MASVVGFFHRNYQTFYNSEPKSEQAVRIGILGAATIAPPALIVPAKSHPEVIIESVAARDPKKAEKFAKANGIKRIHQTYQELLDDKDIDAVYIPLPNGLHYEWTIKALKAGKHVLLEKPSTNNAKDTRKLWEYARGKNLVLLEAIHVRFHPALQRMREIVKSGELGTIKSIEAHLGLPKGLMPDDDIRFNFKLGGGCAMDMGGYPLGSMRFILGANTDTVTSAKPVLHPKATDCDKAMTAEIEFPGSVKGNLSIALQMDPRLGFIPRLPNTYIKVYGEKGEAYLNNFIAPSLYHAITVKANGKTRTEKAYTFADLGKPYWLTYRYQLEAFVDKIKGRTPQFWVTEEDSIVNAEGIDRLYKAAGLPLRPSSEYSPS